jgi:hypothetical protein
VNIIKILTRRRSISTKNQDVDGFLLGIGILHFFHTKTVMKRQKYKIRALKDETNLWV